MEMKEERIRRTGDVNVRLLWPAGAHFSLDSSAMGKLQIVFYNCRLSDFVIQSLDDQEETHA